MKTKQQEFDSILQRTIIRNFSDSSLTIIGDYSSSVITTFWVVDRLSPNVPYQICISRESAIRCQKYLNESYNTNVFVIKQSSIFI